MANMKYFLYSVIIGFVFGIAAILSAAEITVQAEPLILEATSKVYDDYLLTKIDPVEDTLDDGTYVRSDLVTDPSGFQYFESYAYSRDGKIAKFVAGNKVADWHLPFDHSAYEPI